jgi:GNAT superfamily N-acetyltransferase
MNAHPLPEGYEISDDPARLDFERIHRFLAHESYWAKNIPRALVEQAARHSLTWGVYALAGQVGFARVVSDRTTFAYLCDVYIEADHRGHGLSKALVARILAHPELQGLRRWMLVTADAHTLYEPFGWVVPGKPERYMEIHRPDIYL